MISTFENNLGYLNKSTIRPLPRYVKKVLFELKIWFNGGPF